MPKCRYCHASPPKEPYMCKPCVQPDRHERHDRCTCRKCSEPVRRKTCRYASPPPTPAPTHGDYRCGYDCERPKKRSDAPECRGSCDRRCSASDSTDVQRYTGCPPECHPEAHALCRHIEIKNDNIVFITIH